MELDLKTVDEESTSRPVPLAIGIDDKVRLYSTELRCSLHAVITHADQRDYGGNLLEDPETLHLEKGDHLHFEHSNVLEILPE